MHCKQPPLKFNFICLLSSDYKTHKSFIILQVYLQYICTSCDLSHTNTRKSNSGKFQSVNHWNIIQQKNKIWVEIFKLAQRFKDNMPYPAAQDVTE